jgi:hypothetical protein
MSRSKGTRWESQWLPFLRLLWPDASRTGSDHSTEWGSADYKQTGNEVWEAKNWSDPIKAIGKGWPQIRKIASCTYKTPYLAVNMPHKSIRDTLIVITAEELLRVRGVEWPST